MINKAEYGMCSIAGKPAKGRQGGGGCSVGRDVKPESLSGVCVVGVLSCKLLLKTGGNEGIWGRNL